MNNYSLNDEVYGITKKVWRDIKSEVIRDNLSSVEAIKRYKLSDVQVWFLYDVLLQEKYNHLYKRSPITKAVLNDFVYCDYDGFGKGKISKIFDDGLMFVKFDRRDLNVMCCSKSFVTVHDGVKRKLTKL